jgi:hypothetical protein
MTGLPIRCSSSTAHAPTHKALAEIPQVQVAQAGNGRKYFTCLVLMKTRSGLALIVERKHPQPLQIFGQDRRKFLLRNNPEWNLLLGPETAFDFQLFEHTRLFQL